MFSSGVGFSSLTKPIPVACGSSNSKRRSAPDLQADSARKTAREQIEALYRNTEPLFTAAFSILCSTSVSLDLYQVGIGIQCALRDREHHPIGPRYRLGLPCLRENTEANQVVPSPAFPVQLPAPLIEEIRLGDARQQGSAPIVRISGSDLIDDRQRLRGLALPEVRFRLHQQRIGVTEEDPVRAGLVALRILPSLHRSDQVLDHPKALVLVRVQQVDVAGKDERVAAAVLQGRVGSDGTVVAAILLSLQDPRPDTG